MGSISPLYGEYGIWQSISGESDMVLKFREIPVDVWQAVRDKWAGALDHGWDRALWMSCEMCKYIEMHYPTRCPDICPIAGGSWCRGYGYLSRLHLVSYHDNDISAWKADVARFVRMCGKIIKKLEKENPPGGDR